MAFSIDPNIPLQVKERDYGRGFDNMQTYQANALKLQQLRDAYDAEKADRLRQKQMRSGIQTDLEQIQKGTPAQYSPLQYQQTPQRGQMPYGMTGVLANERGQNMPQPQAFGEDILAGNFNLSGGDVTQQAQQGRQPTPEEYVQILAKQAMMYGDEKTGFEALKLAAELKKAKQNEAAKWGNNPTKVVNPNTMQPDLMITNDSGEVRYLGASPYEAPKEPKAVPVMVNGVPKTIKVPATNEVKILMSDGTLVGGGSISVPKPDKNADHPIYFNTTLTGDDFLKTLSPVDQAHVKALNEGREPFPTAKMMASNPYYERLADAVAQYNPDFDATTYSTRKKAAADFSTGIQGRQLLAFGSAVKHLETLGRLVDAMANNDTVQVNRFSNLWQKQTGGVPVNNFEAAKGIVAKEIMKSIVTGGGGVEERQELSHLMDSAKSPQQLKGVIDTYHELMNAQKENLIIQRDAAGLPRSTLPDYTKHSADDKPNTKNKTQSKQADYMEYKQERSKAYKLGNYDLVRRLDALAKQDGLTK